MIVSDDLKTEPRKVFIDNFDKINESFCDFLDLCSHMRKYHGWTSDHIYIVMQEIKNQEGIK